MTPNGADLIATLIRLLEDQEGVKITYTIKMEEDVKPKEDLN